MEYLSCAETAKLIRGALKKHFPGVKFTVKSKTYSGGASIRIGWTDGPATLSVQTVVAPYSGAGFDGMIDLKYSKSAWLMPDGSATFADCSGTTGSMGTVEGWNDPAPSPEARKVHFGADYVFCEKRYSLPTYTAAVEKLAKDYGIEMPEIKDGVCGPYINHSGWLPDHCGYNVDWHTFVHRAMRAADEKQHEAAKLQLAEVGRKG